MPDRMDHKQLKLPKQVVEGDKDERGLTLMEAYSLWQGRRPGPGHDQASRHPEVPASRSWVNLEPSATGENA